MKKVMIVAMAVVFLGVIGTASAKNPHRHDKKAHTPFKSHHNPKRRGPASNEQTGANDPHKNVGKN